MIAVECPKVKFRNARIVGDGVNPKDHHRQDVARGNPAFVMSRGELMRFAECPVKWLAGAKDEDSEFMAWGDLVDCLFLTPEQFNYRFAVCPETYPDTKTKEPKPWNRNANFCKAWEEEHSDKSTVKSETYRQALFAVRDKLLYCQEVSEVISPARIQVSLSAEYHDPATGLIIPIRALMDIAPGEGDYSDSLVDLKTTHSAEPRAWSRKVSSDHLDAQAALYLDIWNAATKEERCDFRHIVQESEPPYHIELRLLSQEFIEMGRIKYRDALIKYCQCLQTKNWPGYPISGMTFGRWALCEPEAWMIQSL